MPQSWFSTADSTTAMLVEWMQRDPTVSSYNYVPYGLFTLHLTVPATGHD